MEARFFEPSSFRPPDNAKRKSLSSPQSNTVILVTPDFSKYLIFWTNVRFPLKFEKFGFNCDFGMITRSLDLRIGSVFVFTSIWVRLSNTCFRALCIFFRAIRSPLPQVQRCPYAYGQVAHQGGAYPDFCSMKRLGVFPLRLDGMLVHHRVTLQHEIHRYPFYTLGWREALRLKYVGQEHNTVSPPRARTRTGRSELSALWGYSVSHPCGFSVTQNVSVWKFKCFKWAGNH